MKFITGLIVGIVLVPVALYVYFLSGRAPVRVSDPPLPLERFLAMTAIHARAEKEMPASVPLQANEATYLAGAEVYRHHCGGCHGLLNRPESPLVRAMSPSPPQLLEPNSMVTDDPPGETFWVAKNGIRLSGMPSSQAALSEEQLWQVSLMLANADKLPDTVKQALTFVPPPAPAAPASGPAKK
ncbi:MAG: c-type cytochrome [Acidobacteriia bacterium]|nr:c-type cytochrome [Terriglobia bacterium]